MNKLYIYVFIFVMSVAVSINADIIKTNQIRDILPFIDAKSVVFFDMDDTLVDAEISLGTGAWRKYVKEKITEYEVINGKKRDVNLSGLLSLYTAYNVPVRTVEKETHDLIVALKQQGIPHYVLTARSQFKWHGIEVPGLEKLTKDQLSSVGLDFKPTIDIFDSIDTTLFCDGIFYTSGKNKGPFFVNVLKTADYFPEKVVFIDDKLEQVESMEEALKKEGIPFVGFWYTRAADDTENFDPLISTIQLNELLYRDRIVSDEEAAAIKLEMTDINPDSSFKAFLDSLDPSLLDWRCSNSRLLPKP